MLDFPNSPTLSQQFAGPNGTFSWDGTKWVPAGTATAPPLPSGTLPLMDGTAAAGTATTYARGDHVHPYPLIYDIGRNKIHNAMFNVQQRGQGPWTASGTTFDRWFFAFVNDTSTVSYVALTDADRSAIGDEEAWSAAQVAFTGSATSGSVTMFLQNIEGVRRLSGKTLTFSFWARAASGTPKLGIGYAQQFGTGGSPSPNVLANFAVTPPLTSTWTRYSYTFTLPSAAGKTMGTSGGDNTGIDICYSATNWSDTRPGNIGQQSGTVQLWGVQLEVGSAATPLEKLDPGRDLANCQRFYQVGYTSFISYQLAGSGFNTSTPFAVTMRASPAVTAPSPALVNLPSLTLTSALGSVQINGIATATGSTGFNANWTASADL
jgi:hypothetical protein